MLHLLAEGLPHREPEHRRAGGSVKPGQCVVEVGECFIARPVLAVADRVSLAHPDDRGQREALHTR
jgi:hypothetical protein